MAHGLLEQPEQLDLSAGGTVHNTACIEHLYATFRERLASLTRKSRHMAARFQALHTGMDLIGCPSNFCVLHQERSKATHRGKLVLLPWPADSPIISGVSASCEATKWLRHYESSQNDEDDQST